MALLTTIIDLPLVIYGLTTGVLAVAAGALVTPSLSMLTVATVAVVASFFGDSLLSWLLPRPKSSNPIRYS